MFPQLLPFLDELHLTIGQTDGHYFSRTWCLLEPGILLPDMNPIHFLHPTYSYLPKSLKLRHRIGQCQMQPRTTWGQTRIAMRSNNPSKQVYMSFSKRPPPLGRSYDLGDGFGDLKIIN
jgi:hypothetical protein